MPSNNLTSADVTALCTAAQSAWDKIGPRTKQAKFNWRGKAYIASHTTFRLLVNTAEGEPVAERYD